MQLGILYKIQHIVTHLFRASHHRDRMVQRIPPPVLDLKLAKNRVQTPHRTVGSSVSDATCIAHTRGVNSPFFTGVTFYNTHTSHSQITDTLKLCTPPKRIIKPH